MGLEEIIADINKRKDLEVSKILGEARAQATKIVESAKQSSDKTYKEALARAELEAKQIMAREQSKANIEAKRMMYSAIFDKLSESEKLLRENMEDYKAGKDYPKLMLKLCAHSIDGLGKDCTIYVPKGDISIVKKKFPKANIVEAPDNFAFGLYASSADGKKEINYGLDAVIGIIKDALFSRLMEALKASE